MGKTKSNEQAVDRASESFDGSTSPSMGEAAERADAQAWGEDAVMGNQARAMSDLEASVGEPPMGEQNQKSDGLLRAIGAAAEWVDIDRIKSWDRNPKRRTEAHIREAMGSLRRFGFGAPMVVWASKGMLVAGHARRMALSRIVRQDPALDGKGGSNPELALKNAKLRCSLNGPTKRHAPVRFMEFSSTAEAEAYAIRDNRGIGEDDDDALAAIMKELLEGGTEIEGLGYTDKDLAKLMGEDPIDKIGRDQSAKVKDDYLVLVECEDEEGQLQTIEALQEQGYTVRALV